MVDEQGYGPDWIEAANGMSIKVNKKRGIRSAVMMALDLNVMGLTRRSPVKRASDFGFILRYGMQYGMGHKGRIKARLQDEKKDGPHFCREVLR